MDFSVKGNIVDIPNKKIWFGEIFINNGKIISIKKLPQENEPRNFILPGFIDAHVHIESSMLVPSEFGRLAVVHGTVATVSDPHEIANVCGLPGVEFMVLNGKSIPFKFYFGAPSCVPATIFETSGATLRAEDVDKLLQSNDIHYLSEMMNFPGVLSSEEEVMQKIQSAKIYNKPVDGHAPGLRGFDAKKYIDAGISTDHECFTKAEALDKLKYGMMIIIREGSAAKNFDALIELLPDYPYEIMFCSDDKHPDSLVEGHINLLCQRAVAKGIDVFKVLQAACVNPVDHYKIDVGLMRPGDPADFIMVKDLENFEVIKTYINGVCVAENGRTNIEPPLEIQPTEPINNFNCQEKKTGDFLYPDAGVQFPIIVAIDGQLITEKMNMHPKISDGSLSGDLTNDILKIVVVNRYSNNTVSKGFIKNFGLRSGAIASSVAHDSHNIIAVGADDESLCRAVNLVIQHRGGISCIGNSEELVLPLPVGGLMSDADGYKVASQYTRLDQAAKRLGSRLSAPFMTLSFMALLVIPHLKLSDKGLFDGDKFQLI